MEKCNLPHEEMKKFEIYSGKSAWEMPNLRADGRVPMSVAGLMQRRLNLRSLRKYYLAVKDFYMDNLFVTGDLTGQKENEVKLVLTTYADGSITPLGSEYLALINPREKLFSGAINLGVNDRYENLQGEGVITTEINKLAEIINGDLNEQQAKDSLFWRFMLRHPDEVPERFAISGLHEEVIPYIFAEGKERFGYDIAMGVFPDLDGNNPKLRTWCVGGLGKGSYANGRHHLGTFGNLVGIAPDVLRLGKGASNIKAHTMADLQAVDEAMKGLEGTLHPDVLKPFAELRKKL